MVMKTLQAISGIVLILIGALFCASSLKLGLGHVNSPGAGLVPFGAGCFLMLFSAASIVESIYTKGASARPALFSWRKWRPIFFVLIPLFVYTLILEIVGFIPSTFMILLLLFKISEKHSWAASVILSLITTALSYGLFGYILNVQFPRGFL